MAIHANAWGQGDGPYGQAGGPNPMPYGPNVGQAPASYGPIAGPAPMQSGESDGSGMAQASGPAYNGNGNCNSGNCGSDWQFFGEYLYMRPRNAEVPYGVVFNGPPDTPTAVPIQVGRPGVADIKYDGSWRAGVSHSIDECNAVVLTYSHFQGDDQDNIATDAFQIRSMVSHPSTLTADPASAFLIAESTYSMKYDLADVDIRWTFDDECDTKLSLVGGLRYASLVQDFEALFTSSIGQQLVTSQIHFEGAGPRIGAEGEHRGSSGMLVYGKAMASFIAGQFRGAYNQSDNFTANIVDTGFNAPRIVTILDAELGIGWSTPNDRVRLTTGYMLSGWFNVLKTSDFIKSVQQNDFTGMNGTITFDGFVSRVEIRF